MASIIKIDNELFIYKRGKKDLIYMVKPVMSHKKKYGRISMKDINFPNKYVGKRFKLRLEQV